MTKIKTSSDPTLLTMTVPMPSPAADTTPPPAAGTTYTFIPADKTPSPTVTTPSAYDGPLAINVRRAPIQGYSSDGTRIKLSKPRYWVPTKDFDQLFNFVTRETNIYFQNQADGVWYKLYVTDDVAMSFTPGKDMYWTVMLYKHNGKTWVGIPPLKNYTFVMTKIKTSSDPTLLTMTVPMPSPAGTQPMTVPMPSPAGTQPITVTTGSDRPSSASQSPAPADFFLTPDNFDYDYYREQAAIKSPNGRVQSFPDPLVWSHFQSTGKAEGWAWRMKPQRKHLFAEPKPSSDIVVNTGSNRPSSASQSPVPAEPSAAAAPAPGLDGSLFLSDVPLYEPTYPVDQGPGPTPTAAPAPYENVTAGMGESFAAY
jgi:hypothetical protein